MITRALELETLRLTYTEHGAGRPLLLLHGNGQNRRVFRKIQRRDFPGFHTWALDSRGHGNSVSADLRFSIERSCDDVIAFCVQTGLKKVHVIGYSDGGNIALFVAKKRPDLVARIVAISPNILFTGIEEGVRRRLMIARRVIGRLERFRLPGMKKHGARFDLMMRDIGLDADDLRSVPSDVCILYAERDMIRTEHILTIARQIPAANAIMIPDTNHLSILKDRKTIAVMKRFLEERPGGLI